jgi:predicted ATPase
MRATKATTTPPKTTRRQNERPTEDAMTISLVEARGFRALRAVSQPLRPFQVLVGPNASGKTTFLDVPAFLGKLVSAGLEAAVAERTRNFDDLTWRREGAPIELAIEARVPPELSARLGEAYDTVRYEVALGKDDNDEVALRAERVLLKHATPRPGTVRELFPASAATTDSLITPKGKLGQKAGTKQVVSKVEDGNDNFYAEVAEGSSFNPSFKLGPKKSALANLPADETRFPIATWLKQFLAEGVQQLMLNSLLLRSASPPNLGRRFKMDGSNLPFVAMALEKSHPDRFHDWVLHLSTALRDLTGIRVVVRDDDKHAYLMLQYQGGLEVPSWMVSDGTLRLLALTLPAYVPETRGVFLIEEPENGIHPRAVEAVLQSLSSVYDAQVLLATHSPVILSSTRAEDLLCFAKGDDGATDIVSGSEHPGLAAWKGETNLATLFASGVLG